MNAFDVLSDPVRRRLLDLLREAGRAAAEAGGSAASTSGTDESAAGELSAGELVHAIQAEFDLSQPTISAHLRVLRDAGFAVTRAEGNRRLYRVNTDPLRELEQWLEPYRALYVQRLDALGTELARGRRERRQAEQPTQSDRSTITSATTTTRKKTS